ncbi:MAG: protein kinase [bacterium]|nr:protein kinase [bacterium]
MSKEDSDDKTRTHVPLTGGELVSHYRIIEKIGAGGMGEVYLAEDTRLKRNVALKFLPLHLVANEEIRTRFLREAQAVAKLNHPNIVTIYDVSEFNGRPFFAMEHVEGNLLHHFAHEKPLPLDTIIDYALQVCQGIGEAHRAGVIHRDIKATNIIVDTKGRARLLDFGLAAMAGDDKLTKTGSTLGTVAYMSPEQVSGREIDHRSDLFSFGLVLYELIAGRTPFRRDNEGATLRAIIQDTAEPLSRYKSGIPQKLQTVIDKLLEKDREMRYQTAEDIIADLKRLLYDSQQTGHHSPSKPVKSNLKLYVGAAVIVVAAALALFLFPRSDSTQTETANAMPMIAVLPFENLGNPDDEYFADGMTEEITSRLVGIAGLGVISRSSAVQYKKTDKSLSQIGKELGVNYILEGSIRWARTDGRPKVRITPRLIRVSDDRNMWSDNYEREMMDLFAVQEDIATKITSQLGLTLLESDRKELAVRPTKDSRAYDYYLKGINELRRDMDGNMFLATANLDSAVTVDPSFALAYAARSRAYSIKAWKDPKGADAKVARESFEKALQLQSDLSYGHMAAGIYYNLIEEDYDKSLIALNEAVSELHGDAEVLSNIALVQWRKGMIDEPNENFRKASELDPLNPFVHARQSGFFSYRRMYADAERSINRAIALDPKSPGYYFAKIGVYANQYGDWNKCREVIQQAFKSVDTVTVLGYLFPDLTALGGCSLDSLLGFRPEQYSKMADSARTLFGLALDSLRKEKSPDLALDSSNFWSRWQLSGLYRAAGNTTLSKVYLDSAKTAAIYHVNKVPTDFHAVSYLGLLFAESGSCDQAIEYGNRGKDLLSLDKCHW